MRFSQLLCVVAAVAGATVQAAPLGGVSLKLMLDKADGNRDGYVSRSEFQTVRKRQFARLDPDGDGAARLSELTGLTRSNPRSANRLQVVLQAADRDHDGKVTQSEFLAGPSTVFDRMDRDRDGRLSRRERQEARAALEPAR